MPKYHHKTYQDQANCGESDSTGQRIGDVGNLWASKLVLKSKVITESSSTN